MSETVPILLGGLIAAWALGFGVGMLFQVLSSILRGVSSSMED